MTGLSCGDLGALYINCTLKPSPEPSHTQGLIEVSAGIMRKQGGINHCAMNVLYSLQHLGYTMPSQVDAGWIGEAGPAPPTWTPAPAARRTTLPTAASRS